MRSYLAGLITGAVAVAVLGLTSWTLVAEGQVMGGILGAGDAGTVDEEIVYRTIKGDTRKVNLQRLVVKIPEAYGQVLTTAGGDADVLWFVDKNSVIRNVILGRKLIRIERSSEKGR